MKREVEVEKFITTRSSDVPCFQVRPTHYYTPDSCFPLLVPSFRDFPPPMYNLSCNFQDRDRTLEMDHVVLVVLE